MLVFRVQWDKVFFAPKAEIESLSGNLRPQDFVVEFPEVPRAVVVPHAEVSGDTSVALRLDLPITGVTKFRVCSVLWSDECVGGSLPVVYVRVVDAANSQAIAGASIGTISETGLQAGVKHTIGATDLTGRVYELVTDPPGRQVRLQIAKSGYQEIFGQYTVGTGPETFLLMANERSKPTAPGGLRDALGPITFNSTQGTAFSQKVTDGPYTYAVRGSLPPGISLEASTGLLSGVPTRPGQYSFTITYTDAKGGRVRRWWRFV